MTLSLDLLKTQFHSIGFNSFARHLEELLRQADQNDWSHLQFVHQMITHELSARQLTRITYNLKRAGFPVRKHLEEFDFSFQTTISKKQIHRLLDFTFVHNRENIVFIGPAGVGKTHLATAIAIKAIDAGFKVLRLSALELVEALDLAESRGTLREKITSLLKFDILYIDELGYLPVNKQSAYNFFQLINALYEYRSLLLTTNKNFTEWHDFFCEDAVAVPIVDRIIHHSHLFILGGDSYRLNQKLHPD